MNTVTFLSYEEIFHYLIIDKSHIRYLPFIDETENQVSEEIIFLTSVLML